MSITHRPPSEISTASLLMHPYMARAVPRERRWACSAPVRQLERFKSVFNRGRVQRDARNDSEQWARILGAVERWFDQLGEPVGAYEFQRGLVDLRRRRVWSVDIVLELGGECCLVCFFHGGRSRFAKHEAEYARRLSALARETYGASVRVICLKVWGRGCQVCSGEV